MLSSCKSPNRGLETFKRSEKRKHKKRKHKNGTQVARNAPHATHVSFPSAKERLFWPNGDLSPSFVRLQSLLDALMRTGLRFLSGKTASNKKYREHVFLFVVNEKANKIFG